MPNDRVPRREGAFVLGWRKGAAGDRGDGLLFPFWHLTVNRVLAYIRDTHGAPPLGGKARLCSSAASSVLRIRGRYRVGCIVFFSLYVGRWGFWAPGCLTCESEERETWTAGSLRAGRVYVAVQRACCLAGRDFGGTRFRSTPHFGCLNCLG